MPTEVTIDTNQAETEVTITTNDASTNYSISAGARGPEGPNVVTTATLSNLTGFIAANGTNVSGATAGSTAATPSTLVLRNANGGVVFTSTTDAAALLATGNDATAGNFQSVSATAVNIFSSSGTGAGITSSTGTAVIIESGTGDHLDIGSGKLIVANNGNTTLTGQLELTGQAATTANSAMTRSLCEASFSNPITQGGTIVQVPAIALQRSTLVNGGTSIISNLVSQTPRVTCTTTLDSSAVLRAIASDGITTRLDSSNKKQFGDKFGWFFIGFLGARGVGTRGKVIIGGNSTPAEMIVEGTLGSDGIALESQPLVANTPRFRLVVRNGATTTVGSFSGTGVYSTSFLGQWWIVTESGTTSAYYRLAQEAWILICSVEAVPATSTIVGGNGVAIVAYTPDAAAAAGTTIQLNQIYETFGITPD